MASNMTRSLIPCVRLRPLLLLLLALLVASSEGGKKRVSIPDELDDVVDDEEDEEWKRWGQKTTKPDLPPLLDFSRMNPLEIQAEMMKRHTGPSLGFVKLRSGVPRYREDVPAIAMRWSKVLRTGSVEVKFMAVDLNTIMFTMERGQDLEELKEFVLSQPEAYEIKIGEQLYRRPGDPPLDEVVESRHKKKTSANAYEIGGDSQNLTELGLPLECGKADDDLTITWIRLQWETT
ncbi:hypothetical protein OPV22_007006 [Ensete ventricosum]|uniref:LDLR chaperone MESD n=1 Tax=Ensete ventricosum TaxID=4639 RepID=A0AAV8RSC5_ENSVE|nr:hypothetical protein OPV22_007006 [Ensete ventricosum]